LARAADPAGRTSWQVDRADVPRSACEAQPAAVPSGRPARCKSPTTYFPVFRLRPGCLFVAGRPTVGREAAAFLALDFVGDVLGAAAFWADFETVAAFRLPNAASQPSAYLAEEPERKIVMSRYPSRAASARERTVRETSPPITQTYPIERRGSRYAPPALDERPVTVHSPVEDFP